MKRRKTLKEGLFFSLTWDYLNIYLPSQHQNSPCTAKAYADALTIFRRYLYEHRGISMEQFFFKDMTYDFLLDYRIFLEEHGYKPNTVNHRITVIVAYMHYAALRRPELIQIYMNVSEVPYVTVPSKVREIIENREALAMLLAAPGQSRIGIRDRMVLVMLYDTAIRADELIGLDLSDVNIAGDEPYIRVRGKGDKERLVALTKQSVPLIQQYLSLYHQQSVRNRPFIYTVIKGQTARMSQRNVERIVQKYGDTVKKSCPGFPSRIYPHMLRRTRATGWYRDGVPIETIAVILGHASTQTTRKSYARPSVDMLRREMEKGSLGDTSMEEEVPLWSNDEELARLCGIR